MGLSEKQSSKKVKVAVDAPQELEMDVSAGVFDKDDVKGSNMEVWLLQYPKEVC